MKKILSFVTCLTLLAFAFPAQADNLDFVRYNSTTAAADAATDTGKILVAGADAVTVSFKNAGSGARTAYVECWDPSQTVTTLIAATLTVAATGGTETVVMDPRVSSLTAPTGVTNLAMTPCHYVSARTAAATGSIRTVVIERRQRFTSIPNPAKQ